MQWLFFHKIKKLISLKDYWILEWSSLLIVMFKCNWIFLESFVLNYCCLISTQALFCLIVPLKFVRGLKKFTIVCKVIAVSVLWATTYADRVSVQYSIANNYAETQFSNSINILFSFPFFQKKNNLLGVSIVNDYTETCFLRIS